MVLQGAGGGPVQQVPVLESPGPGRRRLIQVVPAGVHGQVFGNDLHLLQVKVRLLHAFFELLAVGRRRLRLGFIRLQHGVRLQGRLHLHLQVLGRQLQHAERLLQLRPDDLPLAKPQPKGLLHRGCNAMSWALERLKA